VIQIVLALAVTLLSACLLNVGYLIEHSAVGDLPSLSIRHPVQAVRLLLGAPRWLSGFAVEAAGWGLYVLALALAPLSLVQATAAGGVGILALMTSHVSQAPLARHEWVAVALSVSGLALLGISLAGAHGEGSVPGHLSVGLWIAASVGAAALAVRFLRAVVRAGAAFGIAAGLLFAAGDISTKSAVEGGGHVVYAAALVPCYALGTGVLQAGFQHGSALVTAGIATLLTNALPIAAGMTIFGEPLPGGWLGAVRIAAFAAVVVGAFFLGERGRGQKGELGHGEQSRPEPQPARG